MSTYANTQTQAVVSCSSTNVEPHDALSQAQARCSAAKVAELVNDKVPSRSMHTVLSES